MEKWVPLFAQFHRYLISGILAFTADYGLYVLFVKVVIAGKLQNISSDEKFWLVAVNILSCTCGFFISFILNRVWVFKSSGKLLEQFIRYALLFSVNLVWTNAMLLIMTNALYVNPLLAKLIIICLTTIVNFVVFRTVIYSPEKVVT